MNVIKQSMRFLLMSLLLFVCGVSMAQTQVVFEAGVDKGTTNNFGNHHIDKDGVTFGGSRANLAKNPYDFQTSGGLIQSQKLTVSSTIGNIQKIEIEGKNLSLITGQNVGTFDASKGVWEGNSNNVELTIKYTLSTSNKVTVSKVTVTLSSSVSTTLSFGEGAQTSYTVYKSKETDFTPLVAKVTENKGNTEVKDATVKYSSNNTSVVSVNETTGALTYGEPGEATITASYEGKQGVYDAANSISYNINYKKIPTALTFGEDNGKTFTVFKGDENEFTAKTAMLTETLGNTAIEGVSYKSNNEEVVKVNETTGELAFVKAGTATISATYAGTDVYEATADASYTINYSMVTTTLSFGDGAENDYTVYRGQEENFKALKATLTENKHNGSVEGGAVKYTSNNPEAVSVDENSGELTFGNVGTATITASFDGIEGSYEPAQSISYTINYKKNSLTLAYTSTLNIIYADDKDKFVAPTLNVKSNDTDVDVDKVVYESSNNEVATVAESGVVTLLGVGETTITATVKDNFLYDDATASYTIRIADPENIFSESFDNVNGEGGNDDNWNIDKGIDFDSKQCDNEGWSKRSATTFQAVTGGNQCMNIYGQANLYSPELKYLNGSALLTFRAGADKAAVLTVTVNGKESKFDVPAGEFKEFSMPIEGTPSTKIDFYGYWTAGGSMTGTIYNIFIDDVKVVKLVSLSDNTDNATTIEANNGKNVNILLNRKLSNEYWNTLCLPFDMTEEQVAEYFGAETKIREFNRIENGELVFVKTTNIAAGKPYLVKPENTVSDNVLLRSTINNTLTPSVYTDAEQKEYQFIGVVSPTALTDNDVFIGTDNNLYYPDMDTEGANIINGMRAYIKLPEGTDAKSFVMNFEGSEATGINRVENANHNNGLVYTISGQLVGKSLKNLSKGVYIMNGKKIVVK